MKTFKRHEGMTWDTRRLLFKNVKRSSSQSLVYTFGFIHHPERREICALSRQRLKWTALKHWLRNQSVPLFLESYFKNLNLRGLS